jgi:hypothetical protein
VRCSVQRTLIRRQLDDLMATERSVRPALLGGEATPAPAARFRVVLDDLIPLILGPQLATRTPMPRLPASLTPLTLPAHRLLGLRARLRPALCAS